MEAFSPYPKNPLLASFFVNIGRADTLGFGMRNLYKYTKLYSHAEPILTEGDIFKIWIPLKRDAIIIANDVNFGVNGVNVTLIDANNEANLDANDLSSEKMRDAILKKAGENPHITQSALAEALNVSRSTIQRVMDELKEQGKLERIDGTRGYWKVNRG